MMKRIAVAILASMFGASSVIAAPSRAFGVGVAVGQPFGPTVKYWLTPQSAVDAGVGFSDDPIFYADYLWHSWRLLPKPASGEIGLYAGLGPRLRQRDHDDDEFGFRVPFGVTYLLADAPIELFGELVPVFEVSPDTDTDFDGGVGVRFLFY